jgi:geranylgeranyl diphosphate synthase type II
MKNEFSTFSVRVRPAIESTLQNLLPPESFSPPLIHQAMRYSTLNGGKLVRPSLCIAGYGIARDDWTAVLPVAAAIEMVHSYSLIHDDLPAMDNDDERRGKPSCHRKFNEAIAILAGDALLTLAFETLARVKEFPAERMLQVISVLGSVAGTRGGMIAGQVRDIESEGMTVTSAELESIHRSKTGALICGALRIGAYLSGLDEVDLGRISKYGDSAGLAFQVLDDIDDEMEGRDRNQGKATYPGIHGLEKSRAVAHELLQNARQVVGPFGDRAKTLVDFCDYLENR